METFFSSSDGLDTSAAYENKAFMRDGFWSFVYEQQVIVPSFTKCLFFIVQHM